LITCEAIFVLCSLVIYFKMPRIYFDTNVFSKLKNATEEKFIQLNKLLAESKKNLTFYFSHAHIMDKLKDQTVNKFADFDFMESFTTDNYLSYDPISKRTHQYLATPLMVYNDNKDGGYSLNNFFNKLNLNPDRDGSSMAVKSLMDSYMAQPAHIDPDILKKSTTENAPMLSKILPLELDSPSMGDMIDKQLIFYDDIIMGSESYKDLRKIVDEAFNDGKFILGPEGDTAFNEALKDSPLEKPFLKFVFDNVTKDKEGKAEYYNYYQISYYSLDLLGIKKDTINRKNGVTNLLNDGLHSYYAQYCDYFVTDDSAVRLKSKALYKLFDIKTNVLSVEDCISILGQIGKDTEVNMFVFFEKLSKNVRDGIRDQETTVDGRTSSVIWVAEIYFSFFNCIMVVQEEGFTHYFLRKSITSELSAPNYREQGSIIDRAVSIFGPDIFDKSYFDFTKEVEAAEKGEDIKRVWRIGSYIISVNRHEGLQEFCIVISPLNSIVHNS